MAGHGSPKGVHQGGRKPGTPNHLTSDVKAMILAALQKAGGPEYLFAQAAANPAAFMALVGKVLPLQVTGNDGGDLIIKIVKYNRSDADDNPPA